MAGWLERSGAGAAQRGLAASEECRKKRVDFQRLAIDSAMQAGAGIFLCRQIAQRRAFARCFNRRGIAEALLQALGALSPGAHGHWAGCGGSCPGRLWRRSLKRSAIAFRNAATGRDRLAVIDADIALLEGRVTGAADASTHPKPSTPPETPRVRMCPQEPNPAATRHRVFFMPGGGGDIRITPDRKIASAQLYYRHVNQAERYEAVEMILGGWRISAPIFRPATR